MFATATQAVAPGPSSTQPGDYVEEFVTYGYLINQKVDFGDYGGVTAGFRSDWFFSIWWRFEALHIPTCRRTHSSFNILERCRYSEHIAYLNFV